MEVQFSVTGRTLHLHLIPDEEDLAREGNQCIAKTTAEVELTQACAVTDSASRSPRSHRHLGESPVRRDGT